MVALRLRRLASGALLLLGLLAVARAAATANNVPASGADVLGTAITVADFVPPECASLSLSSLVVVPPGGTLTTSGPNVLVIGTNANLIVHAKWGDTCVLGGGGDDQLYADAKNGTTILIGGAGADQLFGGKGRNLMYGGTGNDRITAAGGKDELYGEEGDDTLVGGGGKDICVGGPGNDTINGCETMFP